MSAAVLSGSSIREIYEVVEQEEEQIRQTGERLLDQSAEKLLRKADDALVR